MVRQSSVQWLSGTTTVRLKKLHTQKHTPHTLRSANWRCFLMALCVFPSQVGPLAYGTVLARTVTPPPPPSHFPPRAILRPGFRVSSHIFITRPNAANASADFADGDGGGTLHSPPLPLSTRVPVCWPRKLPVLRAY